MNILLIEDDEIDVMNIRRAFRKCDIDGPLRVAGDGSEALRILRGDAAGHAAVASSPEAARAQADPPPLPADRRLVLLDLNLPRVGGLEFLRELRADPALRHTPVVVLTTSDEARDRTAAYDLNVAGYFVKPVTMQAFVDVVGRLHDYWAANEMP